ncbi:hypothetical protein [Pseudoalteromonas luteoviolacea]|uniref:N-acetyltransferase domain-containing protein n=1 Tax=Pseudoalteromonas luteoviolacea S4054 TaxID=1129367 RepID=A0A0F6ADD2_9GAMM|nr:hypothetical protein [Pseudoalteromonas luteoviolacea]AOT08302.1 hypothetical protein S4054249_10800 [Pseudoalteromonas luteoviolacea]AOT13218.1 hypothetical protein S40542_10775 [Pseudoalteromonas luteoviolacea]AOT18131.1 hypothetical protein S4054_10775 [Pseudoalteromonas luteoviolacea]KKE84237.1 hypothetical protein N479_10080 [Pseudoalteromonas luteoviolacea S4054]KZN76158.1 hypothetical protein N481_07335 [Pseudoalteromonas luteoviolacea S4047-1]
MSVDNTLEFSTANRLTSANLTHSRLRENTIESIEQETHKLCNTKISYMIHESQLDLFIKKDYQVEACIPCYCDSRSALYIAKYFDNARAKEIGKTEHDSVLDAITSVSNESDIIPSGLSMVRLAQQSDAIDIAKLQFSKACHYATYNQSERAIIDDMQQGSDYLVFEFLNNIVAYVRVTYSSKSAVASISNIVIADHLDTLDVKRDLITHTNSHLTTLGISLIQTQCLSDNFDKNKVLHQAGFNFAGRLINQTYRHGEPVSVNVWSTPVA